jgi:hypothetical protein
MTALSEAHRASGRRVTLLLRDDPRSAEFGTIGLDGTGRVRRIASRFDLGGETQAGVFTGVRLFSPSAFRDWPEVSGFEDLTDWLAPQLADGVDDIGGVMLDTEHSVWEPVGTPEEYLDVNLAPPSVRYADALPDVGAHPAARADLIVGEGAKIPEPAALRRCVVWDHEVVEPGLHREDGVFAGGAFHPCRASDAAAGDEKMERAE